MQWMRALKHGQNHGGFEGLSSSFVLCICQVWADSPMQDWSCRFSDTALILCNPSWNRLCVIRHLRGVRGYGPVVEDVPGMESVKQKSQGSNTMINHWDIQNHSLNRVMWCVMWIWSWSLSLSLFSNDELKSIKVNQCLNLCNFNSSFTVCPSCASLVLSQGFGAPSANVIPSHKRWLNSWNWSCPPATVWSVEHEQLLGFEPTIKGNMCVPSKECPSSFFPLGWLTNSNVSFTIYSKNNRDGRSLSSSPISQRLSFVSFLPPWIWKLRGEDFKAPTALAVLFC